LVLFHHDPDSDDHTVDEIQAVARSRFPNTRAAYEVMEIVL
jgi:phosphoribosyl 1,2-cyclic phosphodiesterase